MKCNFEPIYAVIYRTQNSGMRIKRLFLYSLLITTLTFFGGNYTYAQLTKIMGKVIDAQTKEPIPFVNVYFAGTTIGTISDFNGEFSIETMNARDSITASSMLVL